MSQGTWKTHFVFDAARNEWMRSTQHFEHDSLRHGEGSPIAEPTRGLRRFYMLICLTAMITCSLSFFNDIVCSVALKLRGKLLLFVQSSVEAFGSVYMLELSSFFAMAIVELVLAGLAHIWSRRSPMSFGSGIPEIRCEIQKTHMAGYLHRRVLKAKLIGLMLAEAAGLPIGKEGPFVHCAAAISWNLSRMKCFRPVQKLPDFMGHLMAVSIAIGAVSIFGVPVGGVLFARELLPHSILGNVTYWSCIVGAVVGSFVLRVVPVFVQGSIVNLLPPVTKSDSLSDSLTVSATLLTLAVPLGVICGLLGACFVQFQSQVSIRIREWISGTPIECDHMKIVDTTLPQMERDLTRGFLEEEDRIRYAQAEGKGKPLRKPHSALLVVLAVTLLHTCVSFMVPKLRGTNQPALLWELVTKDQVNWGSTGVLGTVDVPALPHDKIFDDLNHQTSSSLVFHVAVTMLMFVVTALALSIPIPAGCITPSYIIGALTGHCYGRLVTQLELPLVGHSVAREFYPSLALIGSTAFTAAVCHSFSVAVAVFELVGGGQLLLPLVAACIISTFVANHYSPSFFEAVAIVKSLPTLSQPRTLVDGWEPVSMVMNTDVALVPDSLGEDAAGGRAYLEQVLREYPDQSHFAVVECLPGDDVWSAPLIGTARRSDVEELAEAAKARSSSSGRAGGEGCAGGALSERPPLRLCRDDLWVAHQVHRSHAIKFAQLTLEQHPGRDIFVTQAGRVLGVVTFETLLKHHSSK